MAVVDHDSIQPLAGNATTVDQLMLDTAGATNPAAVLHPIETQWPPAYLGFIPDPHTEPLTVDGLEHAHQRTVSPISSSDRLEKRAANNPLLAIWSATRQRIGNYDYLVLPPKVTGNAKWVEPHHTQYTSNKILIRKSYGQAFSVFLKDRATAENQDAAFHMALGGTSGIGKTFCCRYIIWRLFHPDGVEVLSVPDTIFFWPTPKDKSAWLYHKGSFYSIVSIDFLGTLFARNMFDEEDAWMICDGAPPTSYMQCPIIVSSSPANFQINDVTDAKKYFKTSDCKVYLPPWTAEEIWDAAHNVYEFVDANEGQLLERFRLFGGIARSIFHNFKDPNKLLEDLFAITDVTTAINEVGSMELNHQKVSGMILHLVPDNTLKRFTYQWGSIAIMETAFETMFRISKSKIQTFLHAGIGLHLGTFYGLLFEPYFHARITQQGYSGRIRQLTHAYDGPILPRTKRNFMGAKKLVTEVEDHKIPVQELHHFHTHSQIKVNCYNVPDRKNFAAVDAVAPALGEMYQVTSAENHPIKGIHLRPLKKCFESYLATGQRVKLIFVVPPNRFDTYKEQHYIFPTGKTNKKGKGKGKDKGDEVGTDEESKKKEMDEYDLATWDEDEAEDDENEGPLAKANLLQEVNSWIDQYVMEVNVDPLLKTVDSRVESELKKSFLEQWSRSFSLSPFKKRAEKKKEEKMTE